MINCENLRKLARISGGNIYIVGGVTRNFLLGYADYSDIDVAGDIKADVLAGKAAECGFKVKALYPHTGTLLLNDGEDYEYTTFRKESYVGTSHTPDKVSFGASVEEDALRRDFKCNAVYFDVAAEKFVDPLGGIEDIKAKRLTTCRAPELTFGEDGLRIMRLCRFSAELGFTPSEQTLAGAKANVEMIRGISAERIYSELIKILHADEKYSFSDINGVLNGLVLLDKTGLIDEVIPELALGRNMAQPREYHKYDVLTHSLKSVYYAKSDVRLAALLHDIGKPECFLKDGNFYNHGKVGETLAERILKRLKAPNGVIKETVRLVGLHMEDADCKEKENKVRYKIALNRDIFSKLMKVKQADFAACKDQADKICPTVEKWERIYGEMIELKVPFSLSELKVNGGDLIKLGYKGREVGERLERLFRECIADPTLNERERLLKMLSKGRVK